MHHKAGLLAGFGEGFEEVLPAVPAAQDLVDGTWVLAPYNLFFQFSKGATRA